MKRLLMLFNHLENFQKRVEEKIEELNKELQEVVDFNCFVETLNGDGIFLINTDNHSLAPLEECLDIINKDGRLTIQSFNQLISK